MNKILAFLVFLLYALLLLPASKIAAQEAPPATTNSPQFTQKIIVQTDLEEPISDFTITCKQMPKKLGIVNENEILYHELLTDESGETAVTVSNASEFIFTCTSKEPTTKDFCWYFPNQTISFDIQSDSELNKPVYLVGLASPDTCNKEFTEAELKEGIKKFLPTGTPPAFKNKNLSNDLPPTETPLSIETDNYDKKLTLWQRIVQKIKALF